MTNEEKNKAIMENPLLDWTKDQIKSALKKHSKKELLIIAMQWRMKTEECRHIRTIKRGRTGACDDVSRGCPRLLQREVR